MFCNQFASGLRLLRTEANVEFDRNVALLTGSEGQGGGQDGQQVDGDAAVAEDLPPGLLTNQRRVLRVTLQLCPTNFD